jgi:hypothetical protein
VVRGNNIFAEKWVWFGPVFCGGFNGENYIKKLMWGFVVR